MYIPVGKIDTFFQLVVCDSNPCMYFRIEMSCMPEIEAIQTAIRESRSIL